MELYGTKSKLIIEAPNGETTYINGKDNIYKTTLPKLNGVIPKLMKYQF